MNDEYSRAGIHYSRVRPEERAAVREALRKNPMDSWVITSLDRDPFADEGPGRFVPMRARDANGELAGLYSCALTHLHLGGQRVEACYLGGLRLCGKYRGRVGILKGGFESIPFLVPEIRSAALSFTSIASENVRARRVLEAGLAGMPRYLFLGDMETFAVSVRRGRSFGLLERALDSDIAELAAFYNKTSGRFDLSPVLEEKWLSGPSLSGFPMIRNFLVHRKNGRIKACLALWDQREYRQIIVQGYRSPLDILRPFCSFCCRLTRRPSLPVPGSRLEQVFIAFRATDPSIAYLERAFIQEALAAASHMGADSVLLGISPSSQNRDDLRQKLKPFVYATRIYSVELHNDLRPPSLSGIVQPEAALL